VLPREHRFARRARLRLAELAGEDFISFSEGWALRHVLEQAAEEAGFTPHVAFESNEVSRIRALVARGLGIAVLPPSGVDHPEAEELVTVEVTHPRPLRDVTLAWRADRRHSPAAAAFIALARESAA
jgi:DNA-binding transcriptional LysR family regulator